MKLPFALRIPMRVVSRLSAVGSGAAYALLIMFIDELATVGLPSLSPYYDGAASNLERALLFGICLVSAFVLRWTPTKRSLTAIKVALPIVLCSLLGWLGAANYNQRAHDEQPAIAGLGGLVDPAYLLVGVMMLVLFGLPLWMAERRARLGLAGEERGEAFVSMVGLLMALPIVLSWILAGALGVPVPHGDRSTTISLLAALPFLLNVVALGLASFRSVGRSRFLERVKEGLEPAFRIDETARGEALVHVTKQGDGYRVADLTETLLDLRDIDETPEQARSRSWRRNGLVQS